MDINQEKVEQTVLALLYLTSFKDKFGLRAWKGQDWEVMNFLHEKGYISNPGYQSKICRIYRRRGSVVERTVREAFCIEVKPTSSVDCHPGRNQAPSTNISGNGTTQELRPTRAVARTDLGLRYLQPGHVETRIITPAREEPFIRSPLP